jgi:uncharacterized protein (TIGR03382 family)
LNGSTTPPTTSTAWESGTVGDNQSYQVLTLSPGSITASCYATGYSAPAGTPQVFFTSTVVLTFDILSPSTFTLNGTADWFFAHGSAMLSREGDGGPALFTYGTPSDLAGPATFSGSGELVPGRYVLSISTMGAPTNPGTHVTLSATLNVVPAPGGAALGLALGVAVLVRRRRA